ncbi:unknown [Firmicutes bacterium CAG:94]|nr:unknown [Firmicutes bacterium CAG:94]
MIPAILLAIAVYAVCVVLFKGVSYDDVVMLPKGQALARLFRMRPEEPQRSLPVEGSAQPLPAGEALQEEAPRQAPAPAQAKRARGGKYIPRHMR